VGDEVDVEPDPAGEVCVFCGELLLAAFWIARSFSWSLFWNPPDCIFYDEPSADVEKEA
jgi:hypothetical protein